MKKIIAVLLALIAVTALFSCSKKETYEIDAIMDYYVERHGMDKMTEKNVEYKGKNEENGYLEYHIKNKDEEVDETIFVEIDGMRYTIYDEDGTRIHIYNGYNSVEE